MRKEILSITLLYTLGVFLLKAQTVAPSQPPLSAGVYFGSGYMFSDYSALNHLCETNGFRPFESAYTSFETGLSIGKIQKSYIELLIASSLQQTLSSTDKYSSLTAISLYGNLNRTLFFTPKNYLGLYGGIGFTALTVEFSDQTGANGTFADALTGLKGQRTVYTGPQPQLDLGAKYQRVWRDFGKKLLISVKGGYRLDLLPTEWGTDGWVLNNGPNIDTGGWYVQFGIGMF